MSFGPASSLDLARVHETLRQVLVRVDPSIPQERPVRAAELDLLQVGGDDDHLFLVDAGAVNDLPVGGGDKALAPELDAVVVHGLAVGAEDLFQADAVGGADVAAV